VDANAGVLILDPTPEMLETVARSSPAGRAPSPRVSPRGPNVTHDGVRVRLEANVEMLDDLTAALEQGAEGIGLYRTEFLLASSSLESLTEDVQYETYRRLIEGMAPHPVTIRTFDVDEDQLGGVAPEDLTRPAILPEHGRSRFGLRGVRLSGRRRELMKTQLRALLRAGRHGGLRIVFPFVSGIEDLREARVLIAEAATELGARGQPVRSIPVGAMIEVPSAAFTADLLAREADFFTIGTNDLIQCCLAVDRTDERVSHLYEPLHPAILRLIRQVRRAASRQRIPVAVCGEMASDPAVLPLLVGLGLTEFSMTPAALPAARHVISEMRAGDLRRIALNTLKLTTVAEIERYLATELAARSVERVGAGDRRGGEA
jgi:phosphotransferase system enzyme I (PtsI)